MTRRRARTPEAEAARREKNRQAKVRKVEYRKKARIYYRDSKGRFASKTAFEQRSALVEYRTRTYARGLIPVLIHAEYRMKGRRAYPPLHGWNYDEAMYSTRIDPSIAGDNRALMEHLNNQHPWRVHYRAKIEEYYP